MKRHSTTVKVFKFIFVVSFIIYNNLLDNIKFHLRKMSNSLKHQH